MMGDVAARLMQLARAAICQRSAVYRRSLRRSWQRPRRRFLFERYADIKLLSLKYNIDLFSH
jgi:hypothetical protein